MSQARGRAAATTVAGVLGVLLLVVISSWAARVGPTGVFDGPGLERIRSEPSSPPTSPTESADALPPAAGGHPGSWRWLEVVGTILMIGFGAVVAWVLFRVARWAWEAWQARRRREEAAEEIEFDVLDSPARLAAELERQAQRQRDLLAAGSPRNGIVACWAEFEVAAGRIGLARQPWQTAAEFTLQVLELVEADSGAVGRLADLYREARFSEHQVDELHREAARRALAQIHRSLPTRSGVGR
ncbi:MAG TPA: DUF4129 domain-containing protein [Nocardioides sp.]|jgi:hypothetical protein